MGIFSARRRVRRAANGSYELHLPKVERALIAELVEQLRELLTATTSDPSVRRLFPTAYNEDAERDREYQQLVRDELLEGRLAALETVEQTLDEAALEEQQMSRWLTALNDLRLVLGTRLDVSEDLTEVDADDPDAPAYAVYDYLGYLVGEVVDALAGGLPPSSEPQV